jgi:hypothetical protein
MPYHISDSYVFKDEDIDEFYPKYKVIKTRKMKGIMAEYLDTQGYDDYIKEENIGVYEIKTYRKS